MTDYVKSTSFSLKDSLPSGDPLKIVRGTEIDTEFNNIATAVATKADINSPTLTGVPLAPTASSGTTTTQIATCAFVANAVTAYDTALTVSTAQIEAGAVTSAKMATDSVATANIQALAVTDAKLASNAVTEAKIVSGAVTTAKIADANVTPTKLSQPLTRTAASSAGGTSVNITGIPSWAKKVTVMFSGLSTNGSDYLKIQLGTSSGVETTGYVGDYNPGTTNPYYVSDLASGIPISAPSTSAASNTYTGSVVFYNMTGNTWIADGGSKASSYLIGKVGGVKTLGGALDRIRVTTLNGTQTFDAGSVAVMYE